ncbi:MAG TPA: DNA primase [Terriglobales bacterium]|nr:DNA primase [Terriglobales bacterium]
MSNPGDFAYTVKQQADIVRIVGEYVKLKKAGAQNYAGLCPFHQEKTPSFSVHATRQFYHCFGCGASGDVFSFVQKLENVTFPEAVRAVAQKVGIPLPKVSYNSPAEAEEARSRGKLLQMHERATEFFREQLRRPEAAHAREYLAGRGLDQEMIARFRIGFAPERGFILRDVLGGQFDEEALRASGLFSWKEQEQPTADGRRPAANPSDVSRSGLSTVDRRPSTLYSKFRNRIMFPIANESGRVIAFTGRTLSTDEKAGPKYLNSPETAIYSKSRVLFNLDLAKEAIRKLDYAILVEGQMDCISVFAAGFHNVVASSGTAFTELHAKLLGRFSKNAVVNFDPDTAGASATERTLGLLVSEEFQIKVLTLEPGFDPDLYIHRKGKQAYEGALRNAQNYFDYLIERARSQFPVRSPEGKVKAVNFLLPHVQRVPSRIVRDELAREIAQKLGIDSTVLSQELRHAATKRSAAQLKAPAEAQVTQAERILIRALASAGQVQREEGRISARDGVDKEFDPSRQAQFALSSERLHDGLATEGLLDALLQADLAETGADPLSLPLPEADHRRLAATLIHEDEELTPELLEGAIEALRRRHLQRRQRQIQVQIAEAERRQDSAVLGQLLREKLELDRSLSGVAARNSAVGAREFSERQGKGVDP